MLPVVAVDGQVLLAPATENRPPPRELAEFFGVLASLSRVMTTKPGLDDEQRSLRTYKAKSTQALAEAALDAQVFEFGEVSEAFLIEEAKLGGSLFAQGLLQTPYRAVLYWYTLTDLNTKDLPDSGKVAPYVLERVRYGTLAYYVEPGYLVADFMLVDPELEHRIRSDATVGMTASERRVIDTAKCLFMCSGVGYVETAEDGKWRGHLLDRMGSEEYASELGLNMTDGRLMGSLADGLAALTMVLATKGVSTRVEAAPAKLNAKREKAGRAPYPMVTYVDTRAYQDAVQRTARGGTHASPVPHLRRGHVRTYQDGRKVWVRSALVNCRSLAEVSERDHYEVKAG